MKETITFRTPYYDSFRCNKLATTFDLEIGQERERVIEYDAPPSATDDSWRIGVIVGASGSGKTSVAKKHYGANLYSGANWTDAPIIENFDASLSFDAITGLLNSVGFSSIPSWLQPYRTLSNGEQFRCDLARAISEPNARLVVFDEYTSVIDRTVAKTASFAVRKAFDKSESLSDKKFIAVTCHYDVLPWLSPDWILDMRTGALSRRRLRRPNIIVKVHECNRSAWSLFSKYHYLTSELGAIATCYIAYIDEEPCAFFATMQSAGHKGSRRGHRLVVLPEFQGIGIGVRLATFIADYELATRCKSFLIGTSNAYFARALARSGGWKVTERNVTGSAYASRKKAPFEAAIAGFGQIGRARVTLKRMKAIKRA